MTSATGTGGSDFLLAGALLILCHYFKVFCRKQAKGSELLRIRNLLELIGRFELPTSSLPRTKRAISTPSPPTRWCWPPVSGLVRMWRPLCVLPTTTLPSSVTPAGPAGSLTQCGRAMMPPPSCGNDRNRPIYLNHAKQNSPDQTYAWSGLFFTREVPLPPSNIRFQNCK